VALERHFSLANRWGCILLLDEADVFLAERSPQDFQRNGLVAVFLRVLEYYAGVLFLTTNRIGDFDEAFASRIHISLYYPPLNRKSTRSIFALNLRNIQMRFNEKNRKIKIEEDKILRFATKYWKDHKKMRWNGRQIRNACQTALALAEFKAQGGSLERVEVADAEVLLTAEHLEQVANAYLQFLQYLRNVYGRHAEKRANDMGLRARDPKIEEEEEEDEEEDEDEDGKEREEKPEGTFNAQGPLQANQPAGAASGTATTLTMSTAETEASAPSLSATQPDLASMAAAVGLPSFLAPNTSPGVVHNSASTGYGNMNPFMMFNPQAFPQAQSGQSFAMSQQSPFQAGFTPMAGNNPMPGNATGWPNMNMAALQAMMAGAQMQYPGVPNNNGNNGNGGNSGAFPPGSSRG